MAGLHPLFQEPRDLGPRPPRVGLVSLYGVENTGVRSVSAALRASGYRTHLCLFHDWINNRNAPPTAREIDLLVGVLKDEDPVAVGLSVYSPLFPVARHLTPILRRRLGVPVFWGGMHCTVRPDECAGHADAVMVGEAEIPAVRWVDALVRGEDPSGIAGVWTRDASGTPRQAPKEPLVHDLDLLPTPHYGDEGVSFVHGDRLRWQDPAIRGAEYRIYPTRGCPFTCNYCYNNTLRREYKGLGTYMRFRSVGHCIAELQGARRRFRRIARVKWDGDTFAFPEAWVDELCDRYPKEVGIPFEILLHPSAARDSTLRKLAAAGLCKVQMGIQSASEREAEDDFGRRPMLDKTRHVLGLCHSLGVEMVFDVIVDNPHASDEDRRALFDYLLDLPRPFLLYLYSLTHFPETDTTRMLLRKGLISEDEVEGRAQKSFRQFRVSMDWPRDPGEEFWVAMNVLVTKDFLPKAVLHRMSRSAWLRRHPAMATRAAYAANSLKMAHVAWKMRRHGELTWFKVRQFATFSGQITQ